MIPEIRGSITVENEINGSILENAMRGYSPYELAKRNGFVGTEEEWLASLKGDKGDIGLTPDISIGNVTTGQPGTNAEVNVSGTPENPVMDFTIPRGDVGATPNMTIGTVTTGEEGTQAQATITGTPENPVLNLTIPKGDTGDDGFNPVVEVTKDGNTATVSVTDATHTTEVNIVDGYTPQKNVDYFDGHSPKITGAKSQGTTFIYSDGEQIGAIADGQDGYTPRKGVDYFDGHTPAISGEKIDDTTFIYADGVRIATVLDGIDGNSPVITTVKSGKTTSILADSVVIGTVSDGADGHTPTITTTKSGKTTTIFADGTSIGTISDGQDGHSPEITTNKVGKVLSILSDGQIIGTVSDGSDGQDAVTPTITTDKSGTTTTIYSNGVAIGTVEDGADGTTPVITATKSEGITTIKANGVDIATINDGTSGEDGYSPTASVSKSSGVSTLTVTDESGTTSVQISDGTGMIASDPNNDGNIVLTSMVGVQVDTEPTQGSTNTISSGGVYNELTDVRSDLSHSQAYLKQLALNGYFDESASEDTYLHLTSGQINNSGGTNSDSGKGYIWLTSAQEQETIEINPDYSYNLCYMNGETVAKYTGWKAASPIVFDGTTHTKIGITAKKTAGGDITNLLDSIIYIPGGDGDRVGNLATKDYAVSQQQDVADAGKILVIDNSGNVVPGDVPESVVIDDSLSVADDAADAKATGDRIDELATNGFITKGATVMFYNLTLGMADSDSSGTLPIEQTIRQVTNTAYVIVPKADLVYPIYYDNTKYKVNTVFVKDNHQVPGTFKAWQTTSPVQYTVPASYDSMLINVRKLSGNFTTSELTEALYKNPVVVVGNLVTHADLKKFNPQGRKIIYPDGYVSRIKPDIYYSGRYYADIDTDDYKISGTGLLWVSLDGNDSTGDGSEEKPYLTITKALTQSGSTICIKEGTYIQGTHFSVSLGENRNFVGIGNVVLQGDSSGHYIATSGSVYFENIIFEFGSQSVSNPTVSAYCSASGKTACFVKCTFRNGGTNGLGIGGIDVVCKDCVAYGNKLDGFNYHARTVSDVTYIPNVIEIDCVAYNNGSSESENNSCNGSTAHDGVKIIRLNGEYYSCYGGVIAEIGLADDEPTVSLNYGVLAHDSTGTGTYKASFWASVNAQVYLYDCCSYGGDYDLSAINDGKIVSRRLTTGRDVPSVNAASTATVIQY